MVKKAARKKAVPKKKKWTGRVCCLRHFLADGKDLAGQPQSGFVPTVTALITGKFRIGHSCSPRGANPFRQRVLAASGGFLPPSVTRFTDSGFEAAHNSPDYLFGVGGVGGWKFGAAVGDAGKSRVLGG